MLLKVHSLYDYADFEIENVNVKFLNDIDSNICLIEKMAKENIRFFESYQLNFNYPFSNDYEILYNLYKNLDEFIFLLTEITTIDPSKFQKEHKSICYILSLFKLIQNFHSKISSSTSKTNNTKLQICNYIKDIKSFYRFITVLNLKSIEKSVISLYENISKKISKSKDKEKLYISYKNVLNYIATYKCNLSKFILNDNSTKYNAKVRGLVIKILQMIDMYSFNFILYKEISHITGFFDITTLYNSNIYKRISNSKSYLIFKGKNIQCFEGLIFVNFLRIYMQKLRLLNLSIVKSFSDDDYYQYNINFYNRYINKNKKEYSVYPYAVNRYVCLLYINFWLFSFCFFLNFIVSFFK